MCTSPSHMILCNQKEIFISLCGRRTPEGKERRRLLQDDVSCYGRRYGGGSKREEPAGTGIFMELLRLLDKWEKPGVIGGGKGWGRDAPHNLMPCRKPQMLGTVTVLPPPHGHD